MLPDKMEHCIVFMNSWDVSGVFWSFSKCNITIPHFPTGDSINRRSRGYGDAGGNRVDERRVSRPAWLEWVRAVRFDHTSRMGQ